MKKLLIICTVIGLILLLVTVTKAAEFNGAADNQIDSMGYYYAITGGKFPNGQTVNGLKSSGGSMAFILDAPDWQTWGYNYALDIWHKDGWFAETAGLALTMKYQDFVIFDNFNNDTGDFYTTPDGQASASTPGLYRGYCMSNNWDWIYSGYFKLEEETTIDQVIGYFDPNNGFDPDNPNIAYRMNIWSNIDIGTAKTPSVASFTGDVFSSDATAGTFSWGDTGVDRIFGDDYGNITDDIFYLTFHPNNPITLPAGEYWFGHDAIIRELVNIDIKPQSCPNPLNIKSKGVLPVAILGTTDFDVSTINIDTIKLNGVAPIRSTYEDVTAPSELEPCGCESLDPDSFEDLVLKFDKQAIIATLGAVQNNETRELTLRGNLLDGTAIEGLDCVVIKGVK